jgi:acetolactate synthase I/II/III large subunit
MAYHVNFPFDNPLHAGFQYHSVGQNPVLAEADVIVVLDSDVPWIPAINKPSPGALVYYIDVDPVKPAIATWYTPARRLAAASTKVAVEQIAARVRDHVLAGDSQGASAVLASIEQRRAQAAARHAQMLAALDEAEQPGDDVITAEYLSACVRRLIEGTGALVLTEVVTASKAASEGLRPTEPGSVIHHGGGYLGWSGGAALGAALAVGASRPVVSLVGDGSFLFSSPAAAFWAQRKHDAPSLTVIYDNRGWAGPKFSTRHVHPDGAAVASDDFNVSFEPEVDLPAVAVAAGAGFGATVSAPADLPGVLKEALEVVLAGRSAVVSVHITPVQQS